MLIRRHKAITLQTLQRRVDLNHVERPNLPGSRLKLLLESQIESRALSHQSQQGMTHTHPEANP